MSTPFIGFTFAALVLLVGLPNVALVYALRRRERDNAELTELLVMFTSCQEEIERLLAHHEETTGSLPEQDEENDPVTDQSAIAEVDADLFTLVDRKETALLAEEATSPAPGKVIEDLVRAINEHVEKRPPEAAPAEEKKSSHGVLSRIRRRVSRRFALALVPAGAAAALLVTLLHPDLRAQIFGTSEVYKLQVAEKVQNPQPTIHSLKTDPTDNRRQTGELKTERSVDQPDKLIEERKRDGMETSGVETTGSIRRAADLFPELQGTGRQGDRGTEGQGDKERGSRESEKQKVREEPVLSLPSRTRTSQHFSRLSTPTNHRLSTLKAGGKGSRVRYNQAFALYSAGRYKEAIKAFRSLINSGLRPDLIDNCHYWIGESYYAMRQFSEAVDAFQRVLEIPGANKAIDARMKLGYCYLNLGQHDRAINEFLQVVQLYPNSDYGHRAQDLITHLQ